MNEDFHLAPLPPDADTAELLEALGPLEERPPSRSTASFAAAANASACRSSMSKKFWTGRS